MAYHCLLFLFFILTIHEEMWCQSKLNELVQNKLADEDDTLKILSWNIYMLPPLIKFTGKLKRAKAIGEMLAQTDYDLLVFQEGFHRRARRVLRKYLDHVYPYQIGPNGIIPVSFSTNSGIWFFSRKPITQVDHIVYEKKSGFDNRQARKGATMITYNHKGKDIQIIGTHLNSGGKPKVRLSQVQQIQDELIQPYQSKSTPIIIAGDFNIDKFDTLTYNAMISILKAEDGALADNVIYTADAAINQLNEYGQSCIDYQLYKSNGCKYRFIRRSCPVIKYEWSTYYSDLSDHQPVALEIVF